MWHPSDGWPHEPWPGLHQQPKPGWSDSGDAWRQNGSLTATADGFTDVDGSFCFARLMLGNAVVVLERGRYLIIRRTGEPPGPCRRRDVYALARALTRELHPLTLADVRATPRRGRLNAENSARLEAINIAIAKVAVAYHHDCVAQVVGMSARTVRRIVATVDCPKSPLLVKENRRSSASTQFLRPSFSNQRITKEAA